MFEYIKDFQNFLYFEIKTPENYLNIAHKFDKIKKHKNIESIIRKNNDYDYKMLQLRFIYENLINTKIMVLKSLIGNNNYEIRIILIL